MGIPIDQIIQSNESVGNNDQRGTWAIEEVAIKFAAWCSVSFEIWMITQIKTLLTDGFVSINKLMSPAEILMAQAQAMLAIERQQAEIMLEQQRQSEAIIQQAVELAVAKALAQQANEQAEQAGALAVTNSKEIAKLTAEMQMLRQIINAPIPTCTQTLRQKLVETTQLLGKVYYQKGLANSLPEAMREVWSRLVLKIKHSSTRMDLAARRSNLLKQYDIDVEAWKAKGSPKGQKPLKKNYDLTFAALIEMYAIELDAFRCLMTVAAEVV
jgi:hypothetical protein